MKKKRTASKLKKTIEAVANMPLETVVLELRVLLAALYLSAPEECMRIKSTYPEGHMVFLALDAVLDLHRDVKMKETFIEGGFFNEQLELMLVEAKKNQRAGARLMPVFYKALDMAAELKIPDELCTRIMDRIEWQRKHDGFAIKELDHNGATVVPADDVICD